MIKNKTKRNTIVTLIIIGLFITTSPFFLPKTHAATDDSFSIMQISDTQFLSVSFPQLFKDTTSWIVNNSANYNLKMVIHTGDIVDNINSSSGAYSDPAQWNNANTAMSSLLNAGIPYCWDAGNHDQIPWNDASGTWLGSSYTAFNAGNMRSKTYWVSDTADSKNTAVKFSYNGYDFLIINVRPLIG
jgi:predicted MPP superfamily phosphohydrolase